MKAPTHVNGKPHFESCSIHPQKWNGGKGGACDCAYGYPKDSPQHPDNWHKVPTPAARVLTELRELWDAAWDVLQGEVNSPEASILRNSVYEIGQKHDWLPHD